MDGGLVANPANQRNVKGEFDYVSVFWQGNLALENRTNMKPIIANQEIILFAGTSFSKREFCPSGNEKRPEPNTQIGELEQACWAGMLLEMLPELPSPFEDSKAFIWNIYAANQFVLIIQGTQPSTIENPFSIDPYCFLDDIKAN